MKIFVPFTSLKAQVMAAIPNATFCPILDKYYGYGQYFKERWDEKQTFINIEHDVVPRINLLEEMWNCSEPLCVAGYMSTVEGASGISHIGCAKISVSLIL